MSVKSLKTFKISSNKEMVKGLMKQKQWAQMAFYDKYFEPAFHTANRLLRNRMSAEDAVHEGFIKAYNKIGTLKNPDAAEGWLKRIVLNETMRFIKSEKMFTELPQSDLEEEPEPLETESEVPLDQLMACIEELPEGYRVVCQLNLIEEMKHDEIAEYLGISVSTSRSQLTRAKAKLREIILNKQLINDERGI